MNEIYAVMEYAPIAMILLGLILCWNIATARWFLLTYGLFETFELATLPITLQWTTHYYIADIFVSLMFLIPVVYRRSFAYKLYTWLGSEYFLTVYKRQTLSIQECCILLLLALMCVVNFITWIEILAYKSYLIDSVPFKLYLRDNIMLAIHVILSLALLVFAINAPVRDSEFNHEGAS
ncbi:hypothetical protein [Pseudoalteromonas rubra]|uniref:Uncharacterized protein n=1 Tax=Pseudoalteromonas rubra TaxID=43658 RepID=A0A0U2X568_9GAMM|nr:hypothetical protein [Pseudoalteromonas rubra]ALU43156.1 hypothetical protein AT705_09500 [Pseudoalteromonas rubra]